MVYIINMSFENQKEIGEQSVREEKERELTRIRERVAKTKGALDKPVGAGIKEAVVMFNAMGSDYSSGTDFIR